ncbi:MAG: extracellular solute-binding protein [Erysipelotrichales bacterium]
MKKVLSSILSVLVIFILVGCSSSKSNESLYILNVGDYINYDLLDKFEKEYDVEVIIEEVESNEAMYEQIKAGRTIFDIAIPSDYMIDQLNQEGLLNKIDFSKVPNFKEERFYSNSLHNGPKTNNYVPYFNGTIGIMYNDSKNKELSKIVEEKEWDVFFDEYTLNNNKVAMYNASRDAFASALLNDKHDINTTNQKELKQAYNDLKQANYTMYGDDNLKKNVVTNNLDIALVYSGDFFEELNVANEEDKDVNFKFYAPKNNNYWVDGIVIPKQSRNTKLAHTFINYMLEPKNALENASYIGYASPLKDVMIALKKDSDYDFLTKHPYYNPNTIKGLNAKSYQYLGFDYMVELEAMFTKSKTKK